MLMIEEWALLHGCGGSWGNPPDVRQWLAGWLATLVGKIRKDGK